MRPTSSAILVSVWVLVIGVPVAFASAYWAMVAKEPEFIVVGELRLITREAYERQGQGGYRGSQEIHVFDIGYVAVDTVLWGERSSSGVPITWLSEIRLDPPIEDAIVRISGSRSYDDGDRGIWVAWPKHEDSCRTDNRFHTVQYLRMSWLEQVKSDIAELLKKE